MRLTLCLISMFLCHGLHAADVSDAKISLKASVRFGRGIGKGQRSSEPVSGGGDFLSMSMALPARISPSLVSRRGSWSLCFYFFLSRAGARFSFFAF